MLFNDAMIVGLQKMEVQTLNKKISPSKDMVASKQEDLKPEIDINIGKKG